MVSHSKEEALKESTRYFKDDSTASSVFVGKYALRNNNDELVELTPDDMHRRLAREFAVAEGGYEDGMSFDDIYGLFEGFKYVIPQGSPMSAIGNPFSIQSASNCFVIPSPVDSYGGIFQADQQQAQIMKRRGGVGFDISNIRPKGQSTSNAAKTTDGIAVFMDRFSNTCREVAQGGRRGALMLTLSVHHPEIETFINIKRNQTRVTGANISIRVTDSFMQAVKNDSTYTVQWPVDSKNPEVVKEINARTIWNQIVKAAWESAEPGVLFWDNAKNMTPSDIYAEEGFGSTSTNPCFAIDQRLLTTNGYVKFSDLIGREDTDILVDNRISFVGTDRDEKWEIDPSKSGTSVVKGSNFRMTSPNEKLYLLKMHNGSELKVTADHLVATTNGMVAAEDLTPEHEILVPRCENSVNIFGKLPETVDEKCALLMGLIAGDGTYAKNIACIDVWGDDADRLAGVVSRLIDELYLSEYDSIKHLIPKRWISRGLSPYYTSRNANSGKIRVQSTFLGLLLKEKYGFSKETKLTVPEFVINNSRASIGLYYCAGLYYADGSIQGTVDKGYSVRLAQSNEKMLQDVQLILHSNGISSAVRLRRVTHKKVIKGVEYDIKPQYELITTNRAHLDFNKIGFFSHPEKDAKLQEYSRTYMDRHFNHTTNMVSFEYIGEAPVYCLSENVTRSCIVNTIAARRCGEIVLSPNDSCRLMALNLYSFADNRFTPEASFNYELFADVVYKAQHLMDSMIDIELSQVNKIIDKIINDPEDEVVKRIELDLWKNIRNAALKGRRTGLGITGLGDAIASLGIRYGSPESVEVTEKIYKALAVNAYKATIDMAEKRGAFEVFNYEKEKNHPFLLKVISELGPEYLEKWRKYGRRNIALTTTAPTGSVSMMTQTTSGIEPAFSVRYTRRRKINPEDKNVQVAYVDAVGDKFTEYQIFHHGYREWMEVNKKTDADYEESPYFKATANDVDWRASVDIQAAAQRWVCHSISKTCNLPSNVSEELVAQVYMDAWEKGCKGFTVYRDGCRSGILITEKPKEEAKPEEFSEVNAPKRPTALECEVHHVKISGQQWVIFVGLYKGRPYEVFGGIAENIQLPRKIKHGKIVKVGKKEGRGIYSFTAGEGEDAIVIKDIVKAFASADYAFHTLAVSGLLRTGMGVQYVLDIFNKADEEADIFSFNKVISRVLKHHVKDGTKTGEICPNCGADMIFTEGCKSCTCGYSKC